MDRYICFYTNRPFWAGEQPDIAKIILSGKLFTDTLSKRVFEYEDDSLYLAFCKNGLVMTKIKMLEAKRQEIVNTGLKNEEFIVKDYQLISEYLDYLNAIQLVIISSILEEDKIDLKNCILGPEEVIITTTNEDVGDSGASFDSLYNATSYFYRGRYISQYDITLPISIDLRISTRIEVSGKAFNRCVEILKLIINEYETIKILSIINSAISEYKLLNFKQSFIQAWFVIEYYIHKKWIDYLESKQSQGKNRISSKRKEILIGSRNSSAMITNMLELNDILEFDIFEIINKLRKKEMILFTIKI